MLKKTYRLSKKDNISKIIQEGRKVVSPLFLVKILRNNADCNRFAVIVSKKVDKRSTKRNKCRRRIFEAIRNTKFVTNDHMNIVILANKNALNAPYSDIKNEISRLPL